MVSLDEDWHTGGCRRRQRTLVPISAKGINHVMRQTEGNRFRFVERCALSFVSSWDRIVKVL